MMPKTMRRMTSNQLRLALIEDREQVLTLLSDNIGQEHYALAKQYFDAMFSDSFRKSTFVVCEKHNEIIAASAFSEELFTVDTWGVSWVCVDKKHRNQSVGQKIVNFCVDQISKHTNKPSTIILATYPDKTKLYEYCGFKEIGRDHEDGSFMIKYINKN